jgi:hypothetical protein
VISADSTTLSGTAEAGATVGVDTNGDGTPDVTAVADASGNYSVTLNPPVYSGASVGVRATDAAGNTSPVTSVAGTGTAPDTTAPVAPTGAISADGTTLSGTAEAGATVGVDTNGDGTPDVTAVADASGNYSVTLNPPVYSGASVGVRATDAAGNTSPVTSVAGTGTAPDTTAPVAPTGAISADGTTLSGTAEAGATVGVDTNGDGTRM